MDTYGPKYISPQATARRLPASTTRGRRPRVVMVGMHLSKTRGGITTLAASILGSRLREKYDLTYIASQAEDLQKLNKLFLAIGAAFKFMVACVWRRPELVYVHVGSNASLYRESLFIALARLFGLNAIAHFHAGDVSSYLPAQPRLGQNLIRTALGCSHKIIAVSGKCAGYLKEMLPTSKIETLPNAIDVSWLDGVSIEARAARNNDRPVQLLFVGATGKLKGERDLIKALSILKDRGIDLSVSFLGFGAESLSDECAESGIEKIVKHLGPVPLSKRADHFREADIFILPTYAEAMPISVLEAMAAGLPVITTPVGGIPEVISDGEEGILYMCGDINALAEAIAYLAQEPAIRTRMGRLGQKRAQEQLDFGDYIDGLEDLMERAREGRE